MIYVKIKKVKKMKRLYIKTFYKIKCTIKQTARIEREQGIERS